MTDELKPCQDKDREGKFVNTHGLWTNNRKLYQCWQDMKQRCYNPKHKQYKNYGARGIKVCDEWLNSFELFASDMGNKPDGMSIDRIDNNGDYRKDNCRWATLTEQAYNQRRTRLITHNGVTKPLTEWANELGIHRATIQDRLRKGWPVEKALSTTKQLRGCIPAMEVFNGLR